MDTENSSNDASINTSVIDSKIHIYICKKKTVIKHSYKTGESARVLMGGKSSLDISSVGPSWKLVPSASVEMWAAGSQPRVSNKGVAELSAKGDCYLVTSVRA